MDQQQPFTSSIYRIRLFYGLLVVIAVIFGLRLFYLQIIRHDYYQQQAQASQLKQFEIPAERGSIYAYDGGEIVPVVLNEVRYRITADPQIVGNKSETAITLSGVLNRPADAILEQLERPDSRYEILANKQTKQLKEKVDELRLPGIFTNEKVSQRVYIQGDIAAQLLGFVNDAGEGQYGVEEYLQNELSGIPGRVKALTDQNNVPLLATGDNIQTDPVDGEDVVLTIDVSMQRQLESILKKGLKRAISESGSAIILDPSTGAVRAMANYPSYDPAKFTEIEDPELFQNAAVSTPLEPGSITKALTVAAAIDSGAVDENQTYFDTARVTVDGSVISNVEEDGGPATRSVYDVLRYSLNTGATWLLAQMGGGELNEKGRKVWYDYMTNYYQLGKRTGIEQGPPAGESTEAQGIIPGPNEGFGLNLRYANASFGQGITATPLQMVSAFASVVNDGTYYKPTLISGQLDDEGEFAPKNPSVVKGDVVSPKTSDTLRKFLDRVIDESTSTIARSGYQIGGKTGTAEIANPEGGYFEDIYNGTFVGFVGGGGVPDYVVIVKVDRPEIAGYAGSEAARPIFNDLSDMLLDNFTVTRKQ